MATLPAVEYVAFAQRLSRSEYVAKRFYSYFNNNLLDVGCYKAPLRSILKEISYTGIDFVGNPDIKIDLERAENLPFESNAFNTVICIEVLEHLDNLHAMFDELVRVSSRYVIVSLPNCWRDARIKVERGQGGFAHYGLPIEPPKDRHKWFFNVEQAMAFLSGQAVNHGLKNVEMFTTEKPKKKLLRGLRKFRYPGFRYLNRYSNTLWAVFEKV